MAINLHESSQEMYRARAQSKSRDVILKTYVIGFNFPQNFNRSHTHKLKPALTYIARFFSVRIAYH